MERLGGVERMHEQIYSAVTTQRRESLNMALMSFGKPQRNLCARQIAKRICMANAILRFACPGQHGKDINTSNADSKSDRDRQGCRSSPHPQLFLGPKMANTFIYIDNKIASGRCHLALSRR